MAVLIECGAYGSRVLPFAQWAARRAEEATSRTDHTVRCPESSDVDNERWVESAYAVGGRHKLHIFGQNYMPVHSQQNLRQSNFDRANCCWAFVLNDGHWP